MDRKDYPFILSLHYSQCLFPLANCSVFSKLCYAKDLPVAIDTYLGYQQEQTTVTLQEGRGEGSPVLHPLSCPVPALPGVSIFIFAPGTWKQNQVLSLSFCSCTIAFPIGSSCGLNSYLGFGARGIIYCIICYVMTVFF